MLRRKRDQRAAPSHVVQQPLTARSRWSPEVSEPRSEGDETPDLRDALRKTVSNVSWLSFTLIAWLN